MHSRRPDMAFSWLRSLTDDCTLRQWFDRRRAIRAAWKADAWELLERDEVNAYYSAQRLAARARARGDRALAWHWHKAAAEVCRLSPLAEMDMAVLRRTAEEEVTAGDRR